MEINQDIEGISFNKKNQYYIFNIMNSNILVIFFKVDSESLLLSRSAAK